MSAAHPNELPEPDTEHAPSTDYLVRRAAFVGGVVAVIALVSIGIGRLIGSGESAPDQAVDDDWNSVVVLVEDEIRLVHPSSGDVLDSYPSAQNLLDASSATAGDTLVTLGLDGLLTQVDLSDGTSRRERTTPDGVLTPSTGNPAVMAAGAPNGGELTIVDTRTRTTINVGELAELDDPLMFADDLFVNASGSHAAISDRGTFQTVLVDLKEGTAELLAGQTSALNDETVVMVQRAGDQAELDFYDLDADRIGTIDGPSPEAFMLTGDRTAVSVSADGHISTISSSGQLEDAGEIDDSPTKVRAGTPARADTRLVVEGTDAVYVLNDDGDVLNESTGALVSQVTRATQCIVVGDGTSTGRSTQIDLETGDSLGTLTGGIVAATSVDGCTAAIIGAPRPQVLQRGVAQTVTISAGTLTGVTPDGTGVVATGPAAGEELIEVVDLDRRTSLAAEPAVVHFAEVP